MKKLPIIFLVFIVTSLTACNKQLFYKNDAFINGTVINGVTRGPVPGVKISIDGTDVSVKTDIKGRYKILYNTQTVKLLFYKEGFIGDSYLLGLSDVNEEITVARYELYPLPNDGEGIYLIKNKEYKKLQPFKIKVLRKMDKYRNVTYEYLLPGKGVNIPYNKTIKLLHYGVANDVMFRFTPVRMLDNKRFEWPPEGSRFLNDSFKYLGNNNGVHFLFKFGIGEYGLVMPQPTVDFDYGFRFNVTG